jgi:hypothetical protein
MAVASASTPQPTNPANMNTTTTTSDRRVGMYLCHACGKYVEREVEDGRPLKKWRKSYCEKTGKNVRIWLKLEHNMPHQHSPTT